MFKNELRYFDVKGLKFIAIDSSICQFLNSRISKNIEIDIVGNKIFLNILKKK